MSQSQWKAYFSMFVLGQSDPIRNSICSNSDWVHQSCPWYATVINFENRFHKKREYCHSCGSESVSYYCDRCEADQCAGCGERGCGSYMCRPCRQLEQY